MNKTLGTITQISEPWIQNKGFACILTPKTGEPVEFYTSYKFPVGTEVNIPIIDGKFNHVGIEDFVLCGYTNTVVTYQLPKDFDPQSMFSGVDYHIKQAVSKNKRVEWEKTEGAYNYKYFCEFDAKANTVTTNWTTRLPPVSSD